MRIRLRIRLRIGIRILSSITNAIANSIGISIFSFDCECDRKLEFELYLSIANRFHFFLICSLKCVGCGYCLAEWK